MKSLAYRVCLCLTSCLPNQSLQPQSHLQGHHCPSSSTKAIYLSRHTLSPQTSSATPRARPRPRRRRSSDPQTSPYLSGHVFLLVSALSKLVPTSSSLFIPPHYNHHLDFGSLKFELGHFSLYFTTILRSLAKAQTVALASCPQCFLVPRGRPRSQGPLPMPS